MELDHLGIAVPHLADGGPVGPELLGGTASEPEEVPTQRVRVSFLTVGPTHLELLEPPTPNFPAGWFLAERRGGLHHVAFRVPSVNDALAREASRGGRLIDLGLARRPRPPRGSCTRRRTAAS